MVKRLIKKHYTQMKLTKQEFFKFLEYYGIIGMAIGIVMGTAVKDYVNEFVSYIINPLIAYALPNIETLEGWKVANFGNRCIHERDHQFPHNRVYRLCNREMDPEKGKD